MTKRKVLQLSIIIMGIIGATLIIMGKSGDPRFTQIGYLMFYSICALMVLDHIFYGYYSRKYGTEW
ncbi:MAG: hypothetical protein ACE5R6_17030 [Candidatus Heimdallarchaeota archaeon]